MKLITMSIAMTMWALALTTSYAQNENDKAKIEEAQETKIRVQQLEIAKQKVIDNEKYDLLQEVEAINKKLENNELTATDADDLKKEAAEKSARNIENQISIIDNQIEYVNRNGYLEKPEGGSRIVIGFGQEDIDNDRIFGVKYQKNGEKKIKQRIKDLRTTNEIVVAFGLNNAIIENQSLDDSPYKIGGSRFFELGFAWKTRVFENSNWLRFKYGFSLQFNGLKLENNQYLVDTGEQTEIQDFPTNIDKAKFRMDNLVIPIHFEFGPSNKRVAEDGSFRYDDYKKFKMGIGGYAGLNLSTRQKLKFSENGEDIKQKNKSSYNTNNFIYGLSAYVGFSNQAIYLKYDLNSIFKNNIAEQNNVSLGVRFDLD